MTAYSGYRHYSGVYGSKTLHVGLDNTIYQYTDIQSAIDAAKFNDIIIIEPGTYTLTEKLSITKPLSFISMRACGDNTVKITSATDMGDSLVDINVPATYSSDVEIVFDGIYFYGADLDQNIIDVDNDGGANQKLKMKFYNCVVEYSSSAATGIGINIDHTYTSAAIQAYFMGNFFEKIQAVDMVVKHASDTVRYNGIWVTGTTTRKALNTSTDDIAAQLFIQYSRVDHENATSGGHASQSVISINSTSFVSGATYALLDTNDLTGSHSEVIIGS